MARKSSCLAVSEPGQTSPAYLSRHHGRSISRVVLRSYHKQKTSVRPRNLIDFTRAPVARVTCLPGPENDCAATLRAKLGTLNINPRSTVGLFFFFKCFALSGRGSRAATMRLRARESVRPGAYEPGG